MIEIGVLHVLVKKTLNNGTLTEGSIDIKTPSDLWRTLHQDVPLKQVLWKKILEMIDTVGISCQIEFVACQYEAWFHVVVHLSFHNGLPRTKRWFRDYEYVLDHFQSGLMSIVLDFQSAMESECHVLGCCIHSRSSIRALSTFNLPSLFKNLELPLQTRRMHIQPDNSYLDRLAAGNTLILTDLPMNTIWDVLKYLNAREVACMSMVNTVLQYVTYDTTPGLNLTLYPHQKQALKWMLYREGQSAAQRRRQPHPYIIGQRIDPVFERVVNACESQDVRGGFLCDEPGLGKTITVISLLLRTKGTFARPPIDDVSTWSSYGLRSSKQSGRCVDVNELLPSHASLIVVPDTLLVHWSHQFLLHTTGIRVLYDDKKRVPSAEIMQLYDVVVTTFGRLATHWSNHRPLSALERRAPERLGREDQMTYVDGTQYKELSPFLQLHWVRVVVDEGHKLGGNVITNAMQMMCSLSADNRWIMTGTPTPHVAQSDGLRHLHGLLRFLQQLPYGDGDGRPWVQAVAKPFEAKSIKGYLRLERLLSSIMLRHVKADVATIPTPIYKRTELDPTPIEFRIYNSVVGAIRANLVITKWDPETPGPEHKDSLLNPINRKDAMMAVSNLRLASCGGGTMEVSLTRKNFVETINFFEQFQIDWDRRDVIQQYMRDAQRGVSTHCEACAKRLQILMVTPCGHLICADCIDSYITKCGFERVDQTILATCQVCLSKYDWENFQIFQPGFDYKWNAEEMIPPLLDSRPRVENEQIWSSSKGLYVLDRIQSLIAEKKSFQQQRPIKCIIFSDFNEHIFRIRPEFDRKKVSYVSFVSGELNMVKRIKQLQNFRDDPNIHVLFMTEIGAIGLDLSFVTHIFLMDEIWDKSVEQQVIARAHRMGATEPVTVEQLEMRGSMEALVRELYSVPLEVSKKRSLADSKSKRVPKPAQKKSSFRVMNKESMASVRLYHVLLNVRMIEMVVGDDIKAKRVKTN